MHHTIMTIILGAIWTLSGYYAFSRTWLRHHNMTRMDLTVGITASTLMGPFMFFIMFCAMPPKTDWWNKVVIPRKKQ